MTFHEVVRCLKTATPESGRSLKTATPESGRRPVNDGNRVRQCADREIVSEILRRRRSTTTTIYCLRCHEGDVMLFMTPPCFLSVLWVAGLRPPSDFAG